MRRLVFCLAGGCILLFTHVSVSFGDVRSVENGNITIKATEFPMTYGGSGTTTIQFNVDQSEGQETTSECATNPSSGSGLMSQLEPLPITSTNSNLLTGLSGKLGGDEGDNPPSIGPPPYDPRLDNPPPLYRMPGKPTPPSPSTPEPATLLILALGALGVAPAIRRFRHE